MDTPDPTHTTTPTGGNDGGGQEVTNPFTSPSPLNESQAQPTQEPQPRPGVDETPTESQQRPEASQQSTLSRLGLVMNALFQSFSSLPPGGGSAASNNPIAPPSAIPDVATTSNTSDPTAPRPQQGPVPPTFTSLRPLIFTPPPDAASAPRHFADLLRAHGSEAATFHHSLQVYQDEHPTDVHHPIAGPPTAGLAFLEQPQTGTNQPAQSQGGQAAPESVAAPDEIPALPGGPPTVGSSSSAGNPPPPNLYYQLPFYARDGTQALLALPTQFLPRQMVSPTLATLLVPVNPVYVPRSSAHLPFAFLMDWNSMAWPILNLQDPPPGTPAVYLNDPRRPHFVAGPPFILVGQFMWQNRSEEQEEQLDPNLAKTFVDTLETADAELRERMARLSIGDIGIFGGSGGDGKEDGVSGGAGQEGELGCPVCLDPYDETSDRPEWIGGEEARENQVVVIPCPGFHSMHRKCLVEWLGSKPPSKWSCPMCRTCITPSHVVKGSSRTTRTSTAPSTQSSTPPTQATLAKEMEARAHSLREEIHRRERQRGFTCDYQACLPDYDAPSSLSSSSTTAIGGADEGGGRPLDRQIITLQPCGHELHLDCLMTSLRVKDDLRLGEEEEEEDGDEEEEEEGDGEKAMGSGVRTVGKWVECPVDRREVFARIPVLRRRRDRIQTEEDVKHVPESEGGEDVKGDAATIDDDEQRKLTTSSVPSSSSSSSAEEEAAACGKVHRLSRSSSDLREAKKQVTMDRLEEVTPSTMTEESQGRQEQGYGNIESSALDDEPQIGNVD